RRDHHRKAHAVAAHRRHERRRARARRARRRRAVRQRAHRAFSTMKRPIARTSSGVLKNASTAAFGEPTIGSPRTLNEVLTRTGTPVRAANARSSAWWRGASGSAGAGDDGAADLVAKDADAVDVAADAVAFAAAPA